MIRIALDAMGGDRAPRMAVEGAAWASRELDCHIVLVGKERNIKKFLAKTDYPKNKIIIKHAPEVIKMGEPAAASVRRKKNSSISGTGSPIMSTVIICDVTPGAKLSVPIVAT